MIQSALFIKIFVEYFMIQLFESADLASLLPFLFLMIALAVKAPWAAFAKS